MLSKPTKDKASAYQKQHSYITTVAGSSQNHVNASLYSGQTVVKTPEVVVRGKFNLNQPGFLGEELLLNHRKSTRDLGMQIGVSQYQTIEAITANIHSDLREKTTNTIKLPKSKKIKNGITSTITARRSGRNFSKQQTTLQELATILWHAQGVSGFLQIKLPNGEPNKIATKNSPSGGGLYPIKIAILAQNVKDLKPGIYEYQPYSHTLFQIEQKNINLKEHIIDMGVNIKNIGFVVIYVYSLYTNSQKYGDSGVVFALLETGNTAQNINLTTTGLGMISCDWGGYNKQSLEKILQCDGTTEHILHTTLVGHGEVE